MPSGTLTSAFLVPNENDSTLNISPNVRSRAFGFDATVTRILGESLISASVSATTIDLVPVTRSGVFTTTYTDLFYNRIWIIPASIDLTGAPTTYSTTITVWNSYFVQKHMTAVTPTNIFGITFAPTVPKTFNALEAHDYTLSLTSSVPASVNGNYQFIFSDAEDPYLLLSGVLSVVYPYFHDWADNDPVERISYLTNVIESKNGKEQRIRLRKTPRRQLEYRTLLADSNDYKRNSIMRALYHNQMMFGASKSWLVPVDFDAIYLTADLALGSSTINVNTPYYDYCDNGYVLLHNKFDDYEVVRIDTVSPTSISLIAPTTKNWTKGNTIVPLRSCVLGNETNSGNIIVYEVEDQTVTWDVLVNDNLQPKITEYEPQYMYKGYDVYTKKSNFVDNNSMELYNAQRRLDYDTGIFKIDSRFTYVKERTSLKLTLRSKQEISEFLGFLDYRAGKLRSMWILTNAYDIQLTQSGNSSADTFIIKDIGYSLYIKQAPVRRDIAFVKKDGTILFRRITGSSSGSNGTETISIDQPIGFDFVPDDFEYICFLRFVRLDSDSTDINYSITSTAASVDLRLVGVFEVP